MWLAALLLGVCEILGFVGLGLFLRHLLNAKQADLEARAEKAYHDWFDHKDGEPHKFARLLEGVGAVVGASASQSLMASLSAKQSHVARAENAEADEQLGKAVPVLGLLTGGKRAKAAAVAQLFSVFMSGAGGGAGSGNGDHGSDDVQGRIWKGGS